MVSGLVSKSIESSNFDLLPANTTNRRCLRTMMIRRFDGMNCLGTMSNVRKEAVNKGEGGAGRCVAPEDDCKIFDIQRLH